MDRYVEAGAAHALPAVRRELVTYLRRHGDPGSDFDAAELLIGEAVGNAVRHTAGPAWVSLHWRDQLPLLTVHDLGAGFDPASLISAAEPSPDPDLDADLFESLAESGRGLMIMRALAPTLTSRAKTGEGMVVSVSLPVTRPPAVSHDPPMRRAGALPLPEESLPEGGFGKQPFLRALVVQLAQTIEVQHGQDAADAAVAQVGTDVGGRMLDEFRLAEAVTGRGRPRRSAGATCASTRHRRRFPRRRGHRGEDRPRQRLLSLRRGGAAGAVAVPDDVERLRGIASRNSDEGATVLLEERIALGDAGCRVVVELGIAREHADPAAHYYATPVEG